MVHGVQVLQFSPWKKIQTVKISDDNLFLTTNGYEDFKNIYLQKGQQKCWDDLFTK